MLPGGLVDGSPDRTRGLLSAALTVLAALPADGEPLPVLAARLLDGDSHALDDGTRLSALVLRRFGPHCPPLVCTSGWPNTAVLHLLWHLADDGASLRYHGDFDGEGIRIAAHVLARTGAVPWRMAAADYRSAVDRLPTGPGPGRLTPAPWGPVLTEAMAELRTAVVEEVVADVLLDDLAEELR
ncbi:DUF2399 domain-containing protein [Kitasatospora sp. NPDC004669]|uniref:DUF2399 domain-containing protein n=1 Tax=Kitasatospora sp. NPDC004669 TaxID=3154555 RepID=UPI0033BF20F7